MARLCTFLIFALICGQALSMNLRDKRQAAGNQNGGNLDDRNDFDSLFNPCQGSNCVLQPMRPQQPQQPQQTTTSPGSVTTSETYKVCMQNCITTAEYNPVCGTDNVTYTNPGRLYCAQNCGASISLFRASPCPAARS